MVLVVATTVWWTWTVLDVAATSSVKLPQISDRAFIDECVTEHNKARTSVSPPASNMLYMTWDEGLAVTARAWAKHCTFEHNIYLDDARRMHPTFSSVGENIWTGHPPSEFVLKNAIKHWVDEKMFYNYSENSCSNMCGHYTQVVWDQTYKVGCAVELCPNGVRQFDHRPSVLFVCNYSPGGNLNGRRPYESRGAPCSECEDSCENKLCRNKERDTERRYTWRPDWDPSPETRYLDILVVRPVALICTFLAAYAAHYFYPNAFCYE
ncbi:GLIPR1-like protein 1 [Cynoglossus semilaevis]|uniref:GLI pathogenesis related 1 n=1 Tax=Cynoglossus semilaevis TaxID=244447 RepID=A0A3P8WNR5_CYNSE|nr:glioma pathogenesis-related protein 1 [Cynoglossus semilaevis]XP_024913468.1 glioma pathogenesis-related protein 1 [Cynoglossus semilaevis]